MGNLAIKTHDFELAKERLKEFSNKEAAELEIDAVKTGGFFFGLGEHKVTGFEFNERLSTVQQYLIDLNNANNRTIKEFGQVYSALEALDRDYIQAILVSVKSTEETSARIEATQGQIKTIFQDQTKTLEVLKRIKEKLDTYAHLEDIDLIWDAYQQWRQQMSELSEAVSQSVAKTEQTESKVAQLSESLDRQLAHTEKLLAFMGELEKLTHLKEIDTMWDKLEAAHTGLKQLCEQMASVKTVAQKQQEDIASILAFMDGLRATLEEQDGKLTRLALRSEETIAQMEANKALAEQALADATEKTDAALAQMKKKLTLAYWLAGGALAMALAELALIFLR